MSLKNLALNKACIVPEKKLIKYFYSTPYIAFLVLSATRGNFLVLVTVSFLQSLIKDQDNFRSTLNGSTLTHSEARLEQLCLQNQTRCLLRELLQPTENVHLSCVLQYYTAVYTTSPSSTMRFFFKPGGHQRVPTGSLHSSTAHLCSLQIIMASLKRGSDEDSEGQIMSKGLHFIFVNYNINKILCTSCIK